MSKKVPVQTSLVKVGPKKAKEFLLITVWGVDDDSFKVMDTGMNRRPSDAIMDIDLPSKSTVMAAARLLVALNAGLKLNNSREMDLVTRVDSSDWVREEVDFFRENIKLAYRPAKAVGGTQTAWLAFLAVAKRDGFLPEATDFVDQVVTGVALPAESPALACRNWLSALPPLHGLTTPVFLATFIRVFNDALNGRPRKMVRLYRDFSTQFPQIVKDEYASE